MPRDVEEEDDGEREGHEAVRDTTYFRLENGVRNELGAHR
jgi:hypothetical protein